MAKAAALALCGEAGEAVLDQFGEGRLWGCLTAAPSTYGEHIKMIARLITVEHGRRTRDNSCKLKKERFRQDIKKSFFTPRTAKQVSVLVEREDPNA